MKPVQTSYNEPFYVFLRNATPAQPWKLRRFAYQTTHQGRVCLVNNRMRISELVPSTNGAYPTAGRFDALHFPKPSAITANNEGQRSKRFSKAPDYMKSRTRGKIILRIFVGNLLEEEENLQ